MRQPTSNEGDAIERERKRVVTRQKLTTTGLAADSSPPQVPLCADTVDSNDVALSSRQNKTCGWTMRRDILKEG